MNAEYHAMDEAVTAYENGVILRAWPTYDDAKVEAYRASYIALFNPIIEDWSIHAIVEGLNKQLELGTASKVASAVLLAAEDVLADRPEYLTQPLPPILVALAMALCHDEHTSIPATEAGAWEGAPEGARCAEWADPDTKKVWFFCHDPETGRLMAVNEDWQGAQASSIPAHRNRGWKAV